MIHAVAADQPVIHADVVASDNTPTKISRHPPSADNGLGGLIRGRRLGHFELEEPLGVGGMAAVIRARDLQLDRHVALKILPPEMAADPEMVARFHQEGRAAAKLDHENIARVFYFGEDQGLHFIAFELVEGENLRTLIERRGRMPVPEAIHYLLQVTSGLEHAAAKGVVHRDIKPSNIIITPKGRAKLVDMGLARSQDPLRDSGLTHSGVTLGTFDYISPEQALEPRDADVRSDIYSLGCTFYHVLTGGPPVPEGTAAKKLQHHQFISPVDPRQLNPEIPDEVAAILARMMAKEPKDRYQRPEHLMQHLLQVAQKLGMAPSGTEEVFFMDAPLPNPPRLRPFLVAILATCVLSVLMVLHGLAPWDQPTRDEQEPRSSKEAGLLGKKEERREKEEGRGKISSGPVSLPSPPSASPIKGEVPQAQAQAQDVASGKQLAPALARNDVRDIFLTANLIDLTQEEREAASTTVPGLVVEGQGRQVTIQPRKSDPKNPPVIRLAYDGNLPEGRQWIGLTIRGGASVTLRGLRFEVDATRAPGIEMAAIHLLDNSQLQLENCEFIQLNPPQAGSVPTMDADQGWLSSITVEGAPTQRPNLVLNNCYFGARQEGGGQNAILVNGPASIRASQCGFGPHAAWFHWRGQPGQEADLRLNNSSGFLTEGVAFLFHGLGVCHLQIQDCLISCPISSQERPGRTACLVQQTGRLATDFQYVGKGNRYHNLGAFWVKETAEGLDTIAAVWSDFQRKVQVHSDDRSKVLTASPWRDKKPLLLLSGQDPSRAFRLDLNQADLRQVGSEKDRLVGLEQCSWGKIYEVGSLPPLGQKVVDPGIAVEQIVPGVVYRSLGQALLDAAAGDVILLKHNGELALKTSLRLEESKADVTIKPYPEYRPILTLGAATVSEPALFRVQEGTLCLEGLEFHLRPAHAEFRSQAVVCLAGTGSCFFKSCVVTLDGRETEAVPLALAVLADPREWVKGMPAQGTRPVPGIQMTNCLVRGVGDLLTVRASQPFDVRVENSLVALSGSFLTIEGSDREPAASPPVRIHLDRLTSFLTSHLIHLRTSKDLRDQVPVQVVSASNCLFAAARGKALVHLDGEISNEQKLKNRFTWLGVHNAYGNYPHMLDQESPGGQTIAPLGAREWSTTYKDDGRWVDQVKFVGDLKDSQLARETPNSFLPRPDAEPDFQGFGAVINDLPLPSVDSMRGPVSPGEK